MITKTTRLTLRHFSPADAESILELDRNPDVLKYLAEPPKSTLAEAQAAIERTSKEYEKYGTGRVAVVLNDSGAFIGWAGLKFVTNPTNGFVNYHDLGYRLLPKYWGYGYATEAALASLDYGFTKLGLENIYAMAMEGNTASRHVLEKVGMESIHTFEESGYLHYWFACNKKDWPIRKF